jgi:hypothetical protein
LLFGDAFFDGANQELLFVLAIISSFFLLIALMQV